VWLSWTFLVKDLQKALGISVRFVMCEIQLAAFWEPVNELG
jgi:hypothetical protein